MYDFSLFILNFANTYLRLIQYTDQAHGSLRKLAQSSSSLMSDSTFIALKAHLYRQSFIIFASATVAVLLGIAVVVAVLEVLAHEKANLHADFTATMAYIHEQEQFLRKLQAQNEQSPFLPSLSPHSSANHQPVIPVSLLKTDESALWQSIYPAFANHLAQYYALFWSFSDFPAAHLLVLEQSDAIRLAVPALEISALTQQVGNTTDMMDASLLENAFAAARHYFSETKDLWPENQPVWLPLPGQEQRMLALLPAGLPDPLWPNQQAQTAPRLWLAMVLNHQRLQAQIDAPMLEKHSFALHTLDGRQVLGTPAFILAQEGFSFDTQGLALCFEQAHWQGCYRISYARFIGANLWLLLLVIPLLLVGTLGGWAYLRWFRRHVIEPAQQAQHALVQAIAAAQAADQAKTLFLATMSHEIRTPLYALSGSLELLALTHLQPQQQRYLAHIQSAAHLLMQQINDILDINRIESGQMALQPAVFNLNQWLHETVAIYQDQAQQKNLRLLCHYDAQLPPQLLGDSARIGQILSNLLSNAIKFTDSGQIVVQLRQQSRSQSHCLIYLEVSDTGKGIAAEHFNDLFTPFCLPENGHRQQGAGLGLSICQRLAHLMGSQIEVISTLGQGSCFSLQLNLPIAANKPDVVEAAVPRLTWQAHRLHVLIAEDNPLNQATLKDQLQQLGCRITVATNGEQALAQWPRAAFDVLLADVNMPGINGYELVRTLRAQGVHAPVIGMSANALAEEQQRCLDTGMNAWLSKPITLEQLSRCLGQLCPHACIEHLQAHAAAYLPQAQQHLFVQTMNEDLQHLRQSLSHADTARLLQTLHRMRGALAVIDQHEWLARFWQVQETVLQQGLAQAKRPLQRLCASLQTWLDEMSKNPAVSIAN